MKMTMHIDEALLARVMEAHGFATKTEAVEAALREMDRKVRLKVMLDRGLGFTPEELRASVEPGYDPIALRAAELPTRYGKRRGARR